MSTKVLYGVHGNACNGTVNGLKLSVSQKEKWIAARADRIPRQVAASSSPMMVVISEEIGW